MGNDFEQKNLPNFFEVGRFAFLLVASDPRNERRHDNLFHRDHGDAL